MTNNLNAMLAESVGRRREAVVFHYRGEVWTYEKLEDQAARAASALAKLGIKKGDNFGLVLRNCPEFVVLFFALARLGAAAVPINFLEKGERIGFIFADAEVKGCLTSKEFLLNVLEAQRAAPSLKFIFVKDGEGGARWEDLLRQAAGPAPEADLNENSLALLIYTAGTTATPKGVMLTHGNFLANMESCRQAIELSEKDRFLCLLPMFHSFSWTVNVLLPIRLGCSIVIMETLLPFEPVLAAIWKHKVTVFCGVPPIFAALTQKVKGLKAFLLRFVNPVRVAVSGAAPLPAAVHREFEKTFRVPLIEGYGLTEASPVVSVNPLRRRRKAGTVGLPLPGVSVRIVDDEEKTVPEGEVGEIFVRGANVMAGYYKRPEETKAVLTADGWFKTGDLGRLDADGYLSVVDRKKDLIIVKGLNVYPQEIEAVLQSHPSVEDASVVGIPDGKGDEIIIAFVTSKKGRAAEKDVLLKVCRERLAPYKVPKEIELRVELPKNAIGKVLKRDLRTEAAVKRAKVAVS